MDGLSVEVKLCRGDCSLVVSSDKFASPFTLAVEQTCASVEHHMYLSMSYVRACVELATYLEQSWKSLHLSGVCKSVEK
jgi:hypothetical protein